jgi:hypothetical protein
MMLSVVMLSLLGMAGGRPGRPAASTPAPVPINAINPSNSPCKRSRQPHLLRARSPVAVLQACDGQAVQRHDAQPAEGQGHSLVHARSLLHEHLGGSCRHLVRPTRAGGAGPHHAGERASARGVGVVLACMNSLGGWDVNARHGSGCLLVL